MKHKTNSFMKVIKEPATYHQYAFIFDFTVNIIEFCRQIKSRLGWKEFCFYDGKWRFNSISVVSIIKSKYPELEIDESLQNDWKEYLIKTAEEKLMEERANQIKTKTTSDLVIKGLKKELYEYQLCAVEFLINNGGRAIINSDMGTGKSLMALAYVAHEKTEKTLIVTPTSVKWSFENEVRKFTNLKPIVIDSKTKFTLDVFNENQVFIINYDLLKKFFTQLVNFRFECLIIDEVQKIKSISARRSVLVKQISKKIPKIIMLTGSLMLNRPCELFNPLNILDPFVWNNWHYFTKKYCDGHNDYWGYNFSGASNIEELKNNISKYYIRHLKEDVLKDLPEKVFIDVPIELDSKSRFEYDLAMDSFVDFLRDIKGKSNPEIRKSLQAEKLTSLNYLRQIATSGKIEAIQELVEDIIENDQKVIIFSSYNEPLKKLQEVFGDSSVLLIGETPEFVRRASIDSFQNNPEIKVFLCGYSSGGVGITLTAASNIIFSDFPWTPSDMSQAYSRADRIGNKADHINIYTVIARNTIDTKIKSILDSKQLLIDKIFDNKESQDTTQTSIIDDLLKEIQKKV
jgi:SWI/SNF-related matrix-associated actin-dependent regulator 1 of chromatin subfamily A